MFVRTLITTVLAALMAPSLAEESAAVGTQAQDAVAAASIAGTGQEAATHDASKKKTYLLRSRTSAAKAAMQIDAGGDASMQQVRDNTTPVMSGGGPDLVQIKLSGNTKWCLGIKDHEEAGKRSQMVLAECSRNGAGQKFQVWGESDSLVLKYKAPSRTFCVNFKEEGAPFQLYSCKDDDKNSEFTYTTDGSLMLPAFETCMGPSEIKDGAPVEGMDCDSWETHWIVPGLGLKPPPRPTKTSSPPTPRPRRSRIHRRDQVMCNSKETNCKEAAKFSKDMNGCKAFSRGWPQQSNKCHWCSDTSRSYRAGDLNECHALCDDMYRDAPSTQPPLCKRGCDYMYEYDISGSCSPYDQTVVEATSCTGNDCRSNAICPPGLSVIKCEVSPHSDGVKVSNNKCEGRGYNAEHSTTAIATCAAKKVSVSVSDPEFLDGSVRGPGEVVASCLGESILLGCYCHSPWGFCPGKRGVLPVSGSVCKATIGRRQGRPGAKIYALCGEEEEPKESPPTPRPRRPRIPTPTPKRPTVEPANLCMGKHEPVCGMKGNRLKTFQNSGCAESEGVYFYFPGDCGEVFDCGDKEDEVSWSQSCIVANVGNGKKWNAGPNNVLGKTRRACRDHRVNNPQVITKWCPLQHTMLCGGRAGRCLRHNKKNGMFAYTNDRRWNSEGKCNNRGWPTDWELKWCPAAPTRKPTVEPANLCKPTAKHEPVCGRKGNRLKTFQNSGCAESEGVYFYFPGNCEEVFDCGDEDDEVSRSQSCIVANVGNGKKSYAGPFGELGTKRACRDKESGNVITKWCPYQSGFMTCSTGRAGRCLRHNKKYGTFRFDNNHRWNTEAKCNNRGDPRMWEVKWCSYENALCNSKNDCGGKFPKCTSRHNQEGICTRNWR